MAGMCATLCNAFAETRHHTLPVLCAGRYARPRLYCCVPMLHSSLQLLVTPKEKDLVAVSVIVSKLLTDPR